MWMASFSLKISPKWCINRGYGVEVCAHWAGCQDNVRGWLCVELALVSCGFVVGAVVLIKFVRFRLEKRK